MRKTGSKSLLIVILILVIPVVIYGVFELNSLTADEEGLEQIYERQLESVLFSINQVVQDKFSEITAKLDRDYDIMNDEEISSELMTYNFFKGLFIRDSTSNITKTFPMIDGVISEEEFRVADSIFLANENVFRRLVRYKDNGGFLKVENSTSRIVTKDGEADFMFFVLGTGENLKYAIYFFDAVLMIEQNLGPKLQEIARDDFILTCRRSEDGSTVYSTVESYRGNTRNQQLDLMPKYEIGIARAGGTVKDAVNRRKTNSLIALGVLMIVMITGIVLVFKNIQSEMVLAQNKADFVSNVSHEIRTPLALINMFAETLLLGRVKEESKKAEYYEIITKEVGRLTNMINRILSFSKIEANKRTYQKTELSLNTVTQEVFNTYSYHLENNGFSHSLKLSEVALMVNADREAIIEVLVNLIDNGMKYSQDTKRVEVETGVENQMAFIAVKDHGIGIAKSQLDKLFEKFYRVPTGDVHDTKGSGLGLTIVKHIMDAHEGRVEVMSELKQGSAFKLFFPINRNENA